MDLLTAEERRIEVVPAARRWPAFAGLAIYISVAAAAIAHHEPWADEAQSWLLARDVGIQELWTRLLHYEGTTGLWQTLLHLLIRAGLPYAGMNVVAGVLGAAAAGLILWRAPFPWSVRLALPFTYFLCYQYAVIARSYDLLPVLVFACAAWFEQAAERPLPFTSLLCLMAAVSVHGMILAVSIGVAAMAQCRERKRLLPWAGGFAAVVALLAAAAWPAADGTFITRLNFSFEHFVEVCGKAFAAAFTGETSSSLVIVALSIPLLWRGGGLLFFAVASGLLCGVYAIVYSQVWHFGVLFLAWIFALWIAYRECGDRSAPQSMLNRWQRQSKWHCALMRAASPSSRLALAALAVVIVVQCYWALCAVRYDWGEAYSASPAAARELREPGLAHHRVYAIGFACVAIQPYFPRNIFSNWSTAYWDWSRQNHINLDTLRLAETRPDYVIVGYKNDFERGVWTEQVRNSGYQAIRHFEGNSFWHAQVYEPESFDLYRLGSGR